MVAVHRAELLWLVTTSVVWTVPVMATVPVPTWLQIRIGTPLPFQRSRRHWTGEKDGPMKLLLLP
jgi:hypothetical protein